MSTASTSAAATIVASAGDVRGQIAQPAITFICTANRCRSPLAEQLLRHALRARGLAANVRSAGLMTGGFPTPPLGIRVAAANGIDLTGHRSARVSNELLRSSDLILAMTRAHAREIVAFAPDTWSRVYPLKQFTALAPQTKVPRRAIFRDGAELVGEGRARKSILGNPAHDSVRDPMGQSSGIWQEVLADLHDQVARLLDSCGQLMPRDAA